MFFDCIFNLISKAIKYLSLIKILLECLEQMTLRVSGPFTMEVKCNFVN